MTYPVDRDDVAGFPPPRQQGPRRRAVGGLVVAAVLLVLAAVGGVVLWMSGRGDPGTTPSAGCGAATDASGAKQAVACFGDAVADRDYEAMCALSSRQDREKSARAPLAGSEHSCAAALRRGFELSHFDAAKLDAYSAGLRHAEVTVDGARGSARVSVGTRSESMALIYEDGHWRVDATLSNEQSGEFGR